MITSASLSQALDLSSKETLPAKILGYFRARQRNRVHEVILNSFIKAQKDHDITRADVARRMGKRPELITRWLGGPGNITLDTISDLMLAVGKEIEFKVSDIRPATGRNFVPTVVVKGKTLLESERAKAAGSGASFTVLVSTNGPKAAATTPTKSVEVELSPAQ